VIYKIFLKIKLENICVSNHTVDMRIKNIHIAQSGYGERAKFAVSLTNMSHAAFCRSHDLPYATFRGWSGERFVVSPALLKRFLKALEKSGINCSDTWLLTGKGKQAHRATEIDKTFNAQLIFQELSLEEQGIFDKDLQKEIDFYYSLGKEQPNKFQIFKIGDIGMEPYICKGDIVGCYFAFTKQLPSLYGKVCVIEQEDGKFAVRKLMREEDFFLLVPTNSEKKVEQIKSFKRAGEIHWHRRVKSLL
jgi:SOS-response transcriptional repressor LexA